MIRSREDLRNYLLEDKHSLGICRRKPRMIGDEIWKFQILLRKLEYSINCRKKTFHMPYQYFIRYLFRNQAIRLGFTIPPNVFGPGLCIVHYGTIIVSTGSKIGKNCRIHAGVNIGAQLGLGEGASPFLGDDVYIGPGAKLFGQIRIADRIVIGANAVVNKTFDEPAITIAGVPAKKINNKGSLHSKECNQTQGDKEERESAICNT